MKRTTWRFAVWGAGLLFAVAAHGAVTPAQKCAAAKLAAAGKKTAAKVTCQKAFILSGDAMKQAACLAKAEQAFATAFQKAEMKGGCATTGDATSVETSVDACVSTLANELPCPGGGLLCGETCANLMTDPLNCGACGAACSTAECGPNAVSVGCSSGTCKITSCAPGTYDLDGLCSDGCECMDGTAPHSCALQQFVGTLFPGQSVDVSSNLPVPGEATYYEVTFAAGGSPSMAVTGDPGMTFAVFTDPTCTAGYCPGGLGAGPTLCCLGGGPTVCFPPAGTYSVKVFRATGAPTCNAYILRFSN